MTPVEHSVSRRRRAGWLAPVALVLAACSLIPGADQSGRGSGDSAAERSTPGPDQDGRGDRQAIPIPSTTPTVPRNQPWAERPAVSLRYEVGSDRSKVTGFEKITFTPDARVCELVFRAWPNKPETARAGNALVVASATVTSPAGVDVPTIPVVEAAGAPAGHPGTLITLPLPACVSAGTPIEAALTFELTLGADTDERVGWSTEDQSAWFGSAFPLLAWVRGTGWATDPAVDLYGETTVSEDFRLASLEVVAPASDDVLGIGHRVSITPGPGPGTRTHTFTAEAVRDVAVTVGDLDVVEVPAGKTTVYVGGPDVGTETTVQEWADSIAQSLEGLSRFLGPYPYESLWVSIAPDVDGGVEFPGAIQFGDMSGEIVDFLAAHEVAHMWFYGLVGNNQARDPWLDESFAEYASALALGSELRFERFTPPTQVVGKVGEPMRWYATLGGGAYSAGVYLQGGQALLEARDAAGPARFDAAIRTYVDQNAWTVATPDDLERALAGLPAALAVLRDAGALPPSG